MSGTKVDEQHTSTTRHEVHSPERVIVSHGDIHLSDEDMTSEQTSHASETSQAEGERSETE
ncbi:MAG TPA: hypothetical protein VLH10_01355 [Yinghuangia sp.]|uniref:hypothetical protein n=1 Tax=Yinghuangia sp. YIM S10712 TaxID=3436930 RepID=UPI002CC84FAC|nr:hypothetical protein [Yinghuangia sp.]